METRACNVTQRYYISLWHIYQKGLRGGQWLTLQNAQMKQTWLKTQPPTVSKWGTQDYDCSKSLYLDIIEIADNSFLIRECRNGV